MRRTPAGSPKTSLFAEHCYFLVACSAAVLAPMVCHGQSAGSAGPDGGRLVLEEIVVTARKREEKLDKVPQSIAVLGQAALEDRGIKAIDDIARVTPGLDFGRQNSGTGFAGRNIIAIRGIGSTAGALTTGIYVDDIPVQTRSTSFQVSGSPFPRLFDLERVEVLRGPQGTLFGGGAMGGAIRFITPQPNLEEASGVARAEVTSTKHGSMGYESGVAAGAPIVDGKLAVRGSAWYRHEGGFIDRVNYQTGERDADANSSRQFAGKLALTWAISDDLKVTPGLLYQDVKMHDVSAYWENLSDAGSGRFVNGAPARQPMKDRFVLPNMKVDWSTPIGQLTSITAYFDRDFKSSPDYTQLSPLLSGFGDFPLGGTMPSAVDTSTEIWTQEVRLQSANAEAPLRWLVGAFYSDTKQLDRTSVNGVYLDELFVNTFGVGIEGFFGQPLVEGTEFVRGWLRTHDNQLAAFGQLDYALSNGVTFTLGARIGRSKSRLNQLSEGPLSGFSPSSGSKSETSFTPKAGISYQFTPNDLLYFSYAQGFRPGGVNAAVPANFTVTCGSGIAAIGGNGSQPPPFDSDKTYSFELGSKNNFLDGRIRAEASAYFIKWSDVQQFLAVPNCAGVGYFGNFGSAEVKGFNFQLDALVTNNLRLGLAVGYTDAQYTKTTSQANGQVVVAKGDTILGPGPLQGSGTGIVPWTVNATAEYRFGAFGYPAGYLRIENRYLSHNDGKYSTIDDPTASNYDPEVRFDPSTNLVNLRIGAQIGNADVALFANNLTNRTPFLSRYRNIGPVAGVPWLANGAQLFYGATQQPRTLGVSANYKF